MQSAEGRQRPAILKALSRGFVVVSPAIRGRGLKSNGKNLGCAPACIVDYKAAVRFLRYFADKLPGDAEKIITNGTSAGGALSALMGTTGDHPDYERYLEELGAANASDRVFASSCYCPITNLENADMAYEWQFHGVYDYHRQKMTLSEGGRPYFSPEDGVMNEKRVRIGEKLNALFPDYVNSLGLVDSGKPLTLDKEGNGSFKDYIKSVILSSAQTSINEGADLTKKPWLKIANGKAVAMDFFGYARDITRMKTAPAFDDIAMDSAENNLFGDGDNDFKHFTEFSRLHSEADGSLADPAVVKLLNPMRYIDDKKAKKASFFRIRHGERDRDTSLAISAILALKLKESGAQVDYFSPWNTPHAGDYDLDELFAWIDDIAKK